MSAPLPRLSKLMSERGLCSRREADEFIANGWVKVNGRIINELGTRVDPDSEIELLPQASGQIARAMTILLHKPVGFVSGQPEDNYPPAVKLITRDNHERHEDDPPLLQKHFEGLAPAGRLDIDSKGLLIFTQNGQVAKLLIGADSPIEKEYIVRVEGRIDKEKLRKLELGLELDGKPLKRAQIFDMGENLLRFTLREGRKRQIRRMCELVDLRVLSLKRVRVGRIKLGALPEGQWRFLRPHEQF